MNLGLLQSLCFLPYFSGLPPRNRPKQMSKGTLHFITKETEAQRVGSKQPQVIKLVAETGLNSEKREKGKQQREITVTFE